MIIYGQCEVSKLVSLYIIMKTNDQTAVVCQIEKNRSII